MFPDEVRRLNDDLCIVLGRHNPFLCRRLLYYEDYPFYRAARFDPTHFGSQQLQIQKGDAKTAAVLPQLARQQITSFESGKAALFPCGFEVERTWWGSITVRRGRRQLAKFQARRPIRSVGAGGFAGRIPPAGIRFLGLPSGPKGRLVSAVGMRTHPVTVSRPTDGCFRLDAGRKCPARAPSNTDQPLCAQLWAHARAALQRAEVAAPEARLDSSYS